MAINAIHVPPPRPASTPPAQASTSSGVSAPAAKPDTVAPPQNQPQGETYGEMIRQNIFDPG